MEQKYLDESYELGFSQATLSLVRVLKANMVMLDETELNVWLNRLERHHTREMNDMVKIQEEREDV